MGGGGYIYGHKLYKIVDTSVQTDPLYKYNKQEDSYMIAI